MTNNLPKQKSSPWVDFVLFIQVIFWLTLLVVLTAHFSSARSRPSTPLRVFIPCGTVGPVSQALEAFSRENPDIEIHEVVDKGKPLAKRLEKGEECDVFIGRPEEMEPLVEKRLIDADNHSPIAAQILTVVVPADDPANLRSLQDLASPRLKKLAIAPAKSHPGKYTRQALKKLGLEEKITAQQIVPQHADSLPALVGKGEVEAAILFRSCVQLGVDSQGKPISPRRIRIITDLPASSHDPIILSAGVTASSTHAKEAGRLVGFLASPPARQFFLESGFRSLPKRKTGQVSAPGR